MEVLRTLVEAFFPFRCHICSKNINFGKVLCSDCGSILLKSLKQPVIVTDVVCDFSVYTLSKYNSFVADAIKLIKYRPSMKLLHEVIMLIKDSDLLKDYKKSPHIFVPVPMHHRRFKKRGFNQAETLAQAFAEITSGFYSPVLKRKIATRPQASCSEEERLTNLDKAIELKPHLDKKAFKGKTIVVVDDVATTGTTLNCCEKVLEDLKPDKIIGLVVSHSFKQTA